MIVVMYLAYIWTYC